MKNRPVNFNGYTVNRNYRKWHCFMDGLATCAIVLGIILLAVIVVAIATIMIWAH